MRAAIVAYIENDSKGASRGSSVLSERCLSSYASATVHYSRPDYDDQVAYLHKVNNKWTVMGLATGFDSDFLAPIPQALLQ